MALFHSAFGPDTDIDPIDPWDKFENRNAPDRFYKDCHCFLSYHVSMNLRLRYSNSTNTARVLVRKGLWSWKNINWNYGNRCKIHWLISKIFRPRAQHRQPHRTNRKTTSFYYPKRPRQRHRDNRKWNSRNELHWTYRRNRKNFQTARNCQSISGHSKTTTPILQLTGVF